MFFFFSIFEAVMFKKNLLDIGKLPVSTWV